MSSKLAKFMATADEVIADRKTNRPAKPSPVVNEMSFGRLVDIAITKSEQVFPLASSKKPLIQVVGNKFLMTRINDVLDLWIDIKNEETEDADTEDEKPQNYQLERQKSQIYSVSF